MFQFVDWVCMEALRLLENKSQVIPFMNTDYEKDFKQEFAVGETVRVKFPQRFTITNGLQYNPQAINRKYTTVNMNQVFGVHFQWDDVEAALKMERSKEEIKKQYLDPIMAQMASELDSRATLFCYQNTNNIAGALATTPIAMSTYQRARTLLNENSCPPGNDRAMIVSPQMQETIIANTNTIFNPTDEISRQYRNGSVGKAGGFDWYESVQLYTHTAGTWTSPAVKGANQSGSSLLVTLTASDVVNVGDVFQINSVNNVNPLTRRSTGRLKTFVVTQGIASAAGSGTDTLQIYPPIIGPGDQYQNVDALPTDGATITLFPGTGTPNGKSGINGLALHRDAFALVGSPLEEPKAVEFSAVKKDPDSGLSIRIVRAWDSVHSIMTNRIETLMGFGVLYADNCAVRILSAQ